MVLLVLLAPLGRLVRQAGLAIRLRLAMPLALLATLGRQVDRPARPATLDTQARRAQLATLASKGRLARKALRAPRA